MIFPHPPWGLSYHSIWPHPPWGPSTLHGVIRKAPRRMGQDHVPLYGVVRGAPRMMGPYGVVRRAPRRMGPSFPHICHSQSKSRYQQRQGNFMAIHLLRKVQNQCTVCIVAVHSTNVCAQIYIWPKLSSVTSCKQLITNTYFLVLHTVCICFSVLRLACYTLLHMFHTVYPARLLECNLSLPCYTGLKPTISI